MVYVAAGSGGCSSRPRVSFISFAYIDCKLVKSTMGLINYHSHKPFRNSNWACLVIPKSC